MAQTENKTFERNGINYERLNIIELPQAVVNFYRFLAIAQGKDWEIGYSELIEKDIMEQFNAKIEGMKGEDIKELFNLKEAVAKYQTQ